MFSGFVLYITNNSGAYMLNKLNYCHVNVQPHTKAVYKNVEQKSPDIFENNNDPFKNVSFHGRDLVSMLAEKQVDKDLKIIFEKLDGLDGDEFAQTAYKELVKYLKLEDCAPKELTFLEKEGRPIASDYKWYENKVIVYRNYFDKASKAEKLGYIAHELTHCKQTSNILKTDDPNIIKQYAIAIAMSDFNAAMSTNPQAAASLLKAKQTGKEKEYIQTMIYRQAGATYKELITIFADVLKLPKYPLNSANGQKALSDIKAQSLYNGATEQGWNNCPLEKEAMDFENFIKADYCKYTK